LFKIFYLLHTIHKVPVKRWETREGVGVYINSRCWYTSHTKWNSFKRTLGGMGYYPKI